MYDVAVVKYEKPYESLKKAVDLAGGLQGVSGNSKVFIKPNFCLWRQGVSFPKYGVLTTARLIEDIVLLLKEHGVANITIAEGIVEIEKKDGSSLQHVVHGMGIDVLAERYGLKIIDVLRGTFSKVNVNDVTLSINKDILDADYIINMPVLKTHSQSMVSIGIKNLKGLLNMASRKKCHNADRNIDLNFHLARLPGIVRPSFTVVDGIYTLERGPLYTGRAHRSDIIIASGDVISADKVGTTILGYEPETIPHIRMAAINNGRTTDLSDVNLKGCVDIKSLIQPHQWRFGQNELGDLPLFFERAGIRGLTYPGADLTMCTYCSDFIYYVIMGILMAENRDMPFDDIEMLHGKILEPTADHKHTLLIGQCQVRKNSGNPLIKHCVTIGGCPPSKMDLVKAYGELGITLPDDFLQRMAEYPETYMKRYVDRPEFDESFYHIR